LKPVSCMAFGYLFLLIALSEIFPVTAPLALTVAFFTPFMERREFLVLVLTGSSYATLMTFIYRDAMRIAFLGLDIIDLAAIVVLAPIYVWNLEALLQIPDALMLATGLASLFASCFITATVENWLAVLLLRKTGFYRRIGKICPRERSIWKR